MSQLFRKVFDAVNPVNQGPVGTTVNRGMQSKFKSSLLGTAGAGKTVVANLVFLTARTLQQKLPGFYCSINDQNSTIKNDICMMESGHFPPKTRAYNSYAYQTALNMWWGKNSLWGQKSATFDVCDLAGEDMVAQSQYNYRRPDPHAYSQAAKLVDYIYTSDIFILAAPASRAPIFDGDESVEKEDSDLAFNPDVNLSQIFDMIVKRRMQSNRMIPGVAFCLTKCDMIDKYVEAKYGWNLYQNPQDRHEFLNKYFPWTTMTLKSLTDTWSKTQVQIFPMFVETKKDVEGNQVKWETGFDAGNPIIAVEDRIPKYNAQSCVDLINFIGRLV